MNVVSGPSSLQTQAMLKEKWRVLAGMSLILPTGKYDADHKPDVGTGNFRTLRAALQLAYLPTPKVALGPAGARAHSALVRHPDDKRAGAGSKCQHDAGSDPESVRMLGKRNAADIHAEQARDDIDRQREYRDDGQHEQAAAGFLVDEGRDLLLQEFDTLLQRRIANGLQGRLVESSPFAVDR